MEVQFYGANCLVLTTKHTRIVIDDNLAELGVSTVTKPGDIALFTNKHSAPAAETKLVIDSPGEYEVADVSIQGISVRAHIDESNQRTATLYKILADDINLVITGHIYPELSETELETIGMVDVLCVPVGGNGYTLDGAGALQVIKKFEPKLIIPTHYADKNLKFSVPQQGITDALKALSMEPKETLTKLRIKSSDFSDVAQLVLLERS